MNIKIRDHKDYLNMKKDFKIESRRIKNRNIHLSAILKKYLKKDPRFSIVDNVVRCYIKRSGSNLGKFTIDETVYQSINGIFDTQKKLKNKDYDEAIFKVCSQIINVRELGVTEILEYIRSAYYRYSERNEFEERRTDSQRMMADLLRKRIKESKKSKDEEISKIKYAIHTVNLWNLSFMNLLTTLTKSLSKEVNELYRYFIHPEEKEDLKDTYYDYDETSYNNDLIRFQGNAILKMVGCNCF